MISPVCRSSEKTFAPHSITLILIGLGAAGAVFLLAKLSNAGKDSKPESEDSSSSESSEKTDSPKKRSSAVRFPVAPEENRVSLFVDSYANGSKGIDSFQQNLSSENKMLLVGLSLGF